MPELKKCDRCDGTGQSEEWNQSSGVYHDCECSHCHGTGQVEDLPSDYEECGECGFDHEYSPVEAQQAHREQAIDRASYTYGEGKQMNETDRTSPLDIASVSELYPGAVEDLEAMLAAFREEEYDYQLEDVNFTEEGGFLKASIPEHMAPGPSWYWDDSESEWLEGPPERVDHYDDGEPVEPGNQRQSEGKHMDEAVMMKYAEWIEQVADQCDQLGLSYDSVSPEFWRSQYEMEAPPELAAQAAYDRCPECDAGGMGEHEPGCSYAEPMDEAEEVKHLKPEGGDEALVWKCDTCDHVEPLQDNGYEGYEYERGDEEDCVHCPDGVSKLVGVNDPAPSPDERSVGPYHETKEIKRLKPTEDCEYCDGTGEDIDMSSDEDGEPVPCRVCGGTGFHTPDMIPPHDEPSPGEWTCPQCGTFDPNRHSKVCALHPEASEYNKEAGRKYHESVSTDFDKFMDSTLIKESKRLVVNAPDVSPQRRLARSYQEHPLGKTKIGAKR